MMVAVVGKPRSLSFSTRPKPSIFGMCISVTISRKAWFGSRHPSSTAKASSAPETTVGTIPQLLRSPLKNPSVGSIVIDHQHPDSGQHFRESHNIMAPGLTSERSS